MSLPRSSHMAPGIGGVVCQWQRICPVTKNAIMLSLCCILKVDSLPKQDARVGIGPESGGGETWVAEKSTKTRSMARRLPLTRAACQFQPRSAASVDLTAGHVDGSVNDRSHNWPSSLYSRWVAVF